MPVVMQPRFAIEVLAGSLQRSLKMSQQCLRKLRRIAREIRLD
jgi:hypothetical protein